MTPKRPAAEFNTNSDPEFLVKWMVFQANVLTLGALEPGQVKGKRYDPARYPIRCDAVRGRGRHNGCHHRRHTRGAHFWADDENNGMAYCSVWWLHL